MQTGRKSVTTSPWSFASATELLDALARKQVSAVELAEHAIARIERHDGKINAVCVRDFERALEAARAADAARGRGEMKTLLGIPLTVKESYNVAGLPTTWGMPAQKDYHPKEDALAITRIKDAGGVILGKTNVPLGLGDTQSYNDIYGTTNNPYDLSRTPGGSSGGSSAALAAGYGPLSLGSDLAGSLRVPACYCGIFAHKPTLALVPTRGHLPPPLPPLPLERDLCHRSDGAQRGGPFAFARRHRRAGPAGRRQGLSIIAAGGATWCAEGLPCAGDRQRPADADRHGGTRGDRQAGKRPREGRRGRRA
jgi:amidase